MPYFESNVNSVDLTPIIKRARRVVRKASRRNEPPTAGDIAAAIQAKVATDQFARGAQALYVGLAVQTGEDAGQHTLDALGLNKTFAWASQRDFIRDRTAVHGSKIIEQSQRGHIATLADMVIKATNPRSPRTVGDLTREIRDEWRFLTRSQAERIARTEAANVWERTNWYTMRMNGIDTVMWLIASGPAIGIRVGPVCEHCLQMKERSPYKMDELDVIPPLHPHCRCTLVPRISPTWLPPAEPWTGSQSVPRIFSSPPGPGRVIKARVPRLQDTGAIGWNSGGWLTPFQVGDDSDETAMTLLRDT